MPRFLPALRGLRAAGGTPRDLESKTVVLSDYYDQLLANSGGSTRDKASKPWTPERAVAEAYERVPWVHKAVETIAGASSRLRFGLRQGDDDVEDHPLHRVLNQRANPLETGRAFRKRLSALALLSKPGVFVEVTKSRRGEIARLDLLPPGRVRIVPGTGQDLVKRFDLLDTSGRVLRSLDPEQVRWVREPHPLDPYSGVTPLDSAGMSVELDYFARLVNISFLRNDGRPGGIVGVKGDMDETEMDTLESRFDRGPTKAGKLSVVSGDLTYVDLAARPRDMQYEHLARNAKVEVLVAFGVPESQIGHASERTYANAEHEGYAFWSITMATHNDMIVSAFDEDSEDDLTGYLDTSGIEVLDLPNRARRAEALAELEAGARSLRSYAELAGYADEVEDNALTRALWITSGRTPIPGREGDDEILGTGQADEAPRDPKAVADKPAPAALPAAEPDEPAPELPAAPAGRKPPALEAAKPPLALTKAARPRLRLVERETVYDPDPALRDDLEIAITEALAALAEGWLERAAARLSSPKQRRGTRHWQPTYANDTRLGNKALDATRIIDAARWAADAQTAVAARVRDAALAAARQLGDALGVAPPAGPAGPAGPTGPGRELPAGVQSVLAAGPGVDAALLKEAVLPVLTLVGDSATRLAEDLAGQVNNADQGGAGHDDLLRLVAGYADTVARWAAGLAVHAATAVTEAARYAAATTPDAPALTREWRSRRDALTRPTHGPATEGDGPPGADGQSRAADEPFEVGGALLRYPGDPHGPLRETANCRCSVRWRAAATGRFTRPPVESAS